MHTSLPKRMAPLVGALIVLAIALVPAQTASAEGGTATDIDAGGYHSCAITSAERLKCWGDNIHGQLGIGDTLVDQFKPVLVPDFQNVKKVSTGADVTCAIAGAAGKLKCWGDNSYGQVGDGTTDDRHSPVTVIESGVKQVDVGYSHTCARLANGKAKCWGYNTFGELGDGTTTQRLRPRLVERLPSVANISAGEQYTCVTTTSGKAKCWGLNDSAQLGDGTYDDRDRPTQVFGLTQNVHVVKAGYKTTCAIVGGGKLKCWGGNSNGEVGSGSTGGSYPKPTNVVGMDKNITSVDPDYFFTCAQQGDKAKCWGWNTSNQLGNGDTDDRDVATTVSGLGKNVVDVTAGYYHGCALLKSGTAKCWGSNSDGAVGNDSEGTDQWATPQSVLL